MKKIFTIVCIIVMLFTVSAVAENDTYLLNAWESVGSPYQINAVYRYHYQGIDNLSDNSEPYCNLETLFDNQDLPDSGYFFIIRTASNNYYVLEDESGSVKDTMDYNETNEESQRLNAEFDEIMKQIQNPYNSQSKIDELREKAKLFNYSLSEKYAYQVVAAAAYNLSVVGVASSPMGEEMNCWFMYDENQLIKLLK